MIRWFEIEADRLFAIEYSARAATIPSPAEKCFFPKAGNKPLLRSVVIKMEAPVPHVPSTFENLMLPHLDAAFNLARWLLRNERDAEDAVQDAFLRAHRAFERFRGGDGRAWLLCIVRNVCYSHLRKNRRAPETEPFVEDTHGSPDAAAENNAAFWRETKSELLQRALDTLSPEYREVIVLHELEGLPYRDIAVVAEIPLGTVMSRLARGRQKLHTAVLTLAGKNVSNEL